MTTKVNPPHAQAGPVLFAAVCAVGSAFTLVGLFTLPFGSEPWLVGAIGQLVFIGGFVLIEGGRLWIQREVAFSDDRIVIRRWIDAIRGRSGRMIPLGDETRASITLENLRSLRIERNGVTETVLTLGYWEPSHVRNLIDAFRAYEVPFAHYWVGAYPPDLS